MSKRPIQTDDKYVLRFPEGMRNELKALAARNKRSMNAEIVHRLDVSLRSFAYEMDFEAGGSKIGAIQDWRERKSISDLDEDGLVKAIVEITDDLRLAAETLAEVRRTKEAFRQHNDYMKD